MQGRDLTDLLVLGAIWGASFLFMRIAVPDFGPAALIELRVGIAALFLIPLMLWRGNAYRLLRQWKAMLVVGVFNAGLPFLLYAYAAQRLGAGFLSITNAVVPMWGAAIAWLWFRDRLPALRIVGLAIGFAGIMVLCWDKLDFSNDMDDSLAVLAALAAPLSYGIGTNWTKRYLSAVDAVTNAAGTMISAALVLLPFAIWTWPAAPAPLRSWTATVLLAFLCTGVAYVIFFRLIAAVGPTRAVSVTFLVPVFGVLWGVLLLDEQVTSNIVAGAVVILVGTALALGLVRMPARRPH
jgi:drug/metabolite transporter (DMT)-like permease